MQEVDHSVIMQKIIRFIWVCRSLKLENPHVFPYMEFQKFKHHPMIKRMLEEEKGYRMEQGL